MGQRLGFSDTDIRKVNTFYQVNGGLKIINEPIITSVIKLTRLWDFETACFIMNHHALKRSNWDIFRVLESSKMSGPTIFFWKIDLTK